MTIKDIAEKVGVSVATVSRVINNSGYVKEETRKKVEEIIKEYNYCPNAVARSLIKKERTMIGLVMPGRVNPFFATIIDGVETKAEEKGHHVLFYNTFEDLDKEHKAIQQLMEQQVLGLLVLPIIDQDEETKKLLLQAEEIGIPTVLIDRDLDEPVFDAVFMDNQGAVYDAVETFIENDHKDIAIVSCIDSQKPGFNRLEGYLSCLKKHQIPIKDNYIYHGTFDQESGYQACKQFMKLQEPPTAILATSSSATLGCIRYFNEQGMKPGKDIGLIGFDDIATLNMIGYPITVIDRPMKEMGEMAYEVLINIVNQKKKNRRIQELILKGKIIKRGSEVYSSSKD